MPTSPHLINEASSTQGGLPIETTATDGDRKPPKQLSDARAEFDAYLREGNAPGHFLSVNSPSGPKRRQDVNGISSKQHAYIQEHYRWHASKRRWTMKNGGQLVTEQKIYDAILSHQRVIENQAGDAVYEYMKTRFEGVHIKDVRKAHALWQQHNLGDSDTSDDILWGGQVATIVPHEDPLMTPDDSDSDSGSESASAYANEDNTTIDHKSPRSLSTSKHSYTFHPRKPHTLLVGTSGNDGNDAWLSITKFFGKLNSYRSNFYDHQGIKHTEDQLNILWHDEFRYSKFPLHYQKQTQRRHIYAILKAHEVQVTGEGASGQVSKDGNFEAASDVEPILHTTSSKRRPSSRRKSPAVPRNVYVESSDDDRPIIQAKRLRRTTVPTDPVATPTHESSSEVEVLSTRSTRPECTDEKTSTTTTNVLSSSEIAATTLLVSASNQPALAPVHVPFRKCPTHKKLFETLDTLFEELVTMGYLKGKTASDFDMVSATYTWVEARQLMRRGNYDDWELFLRTLEKAWKKKSKIFEEDDCKIGLLVHLKD